MYGETASKCKSGNVALFRELITVAAAVSLITRVYVNIIHPRNELCDEFFVAV